MGCTLVTEPIGKSGLVGIARMAAASPRVRERAEVEYYRLAARSTLNRESSGRMPFAWTINPYRGCEFGCKYCYARYTHEFMEMWDGRDFERKIYAKVDARSCCARNCAKRAIRGCPSRSARRPIRISPPKSSSKLPVACWRSLRNSAGWISPSLPNPH